MPECECAHLCGIPVNAQLEIRRNEEGISSTSSRSYLLLQSTFMNSYLKLMLTYTLYRAFSHPNTLQQFFLLFYFIRQVEQEINKIKSAFTPNYMVLAHNQRGVQEGMHILTNYMPDVSSKTITHLNWKLYRQFWHSIITQSLNFSIMRGVFWAEVLNGWIGC